MNTAMNNGTDDTALRDRLLGALIGLARATVGSEELMNDVTHMVVLEGLCALGDRHGGRDRFIQLIGWSEVEKRRIVPNCFNCAAPCGRTADCDAALIYATDDDASRLKRKMLDDLCTAAEPALETLRHGGALGEEREFFYNALFALGEDWPIEYLSPVAEAVSDLAASKSNS